MDAKLGIDDGQRVGPDLAGPDRVVGGEIAQALQDKRVTAQELVEAAIGRHERFGERLNAYSLWSPEQARVVAKAAEAA